MTLDEDSRHDPNQVVESIASSPLGESGPGEASLDQLLQDARANGPVSAENLRAIVDRILASGEFCRDTEGGSLLHPRGKIAFRQTSRRNSLHVAIGEDDISIHIDAISPLARDQSDPASSRCTYSYARVLAHIGTNILGKVGHRPASPTGDHLEIQTAPEAKERAGSGPGTGSPPPGTDNGPVPFSPIDEAVYLLDNPVEPWTVHLEVQVGGTLDETRLRRAVHTALQHHPMARARRAPSERGRSKFGWEVTIEPDVDPLRVEDCPDDEALARTRDDFYSLSIPLTTSPPLRVLLVHHRLGDVVMLALHHAAADIVAGFGLLESMAHGYAGTADTSTPLVAMSPRDLQASLRPRGVKEALRRTLTAGAEVWRFSRHSCHLTGDHGQNRSGYGVALLPLSKDLSTALTASPDGRPTDELLIAGLHQAIEVWNLGRESPAGRITVGVPVDLRSPGYNDAAPGNLLCMVPVSTLPADRRDPSRLLDEIARRMRQVRHARSAAAVVGVLGFLQRFLPLSVKPAFVVRVTGNPFSPTALIHNLGTPHQFDFGGGMGVDHVWFSPPAMMPEALSIGVVMSNGCLHLAFRYRLALWSGEEANGFAADYAGTLERLGASLLASHRVETY